ncbi:hypothetical protein BSY17_3291 (plasmid) [Sphingobium sp. RAC03]|nr:hypothetical protein BSY17_3291 [Sphingobium sp. RAC03]
MEPASRHPITPDGRYFVVRGRLWRMNNPSLAEHARLMLVSELMKARREVRAAREQADPQAEGDSQDAEFLNLWLPVGGHCHGCIDWIAGRL